MGGEQLDDGEQGVLRWFHEALPGSVLALAVIMSLLALGCTDDEEEPIYRAPTSPDNVLHNLGAAYTERDSVAYAGLLADDFRFYLDSRTSQQLEIDSWTRIEDARRTGLLFGHSEITEIVIALEYPVGDEPVTGAGRERWRMKQVTDTYLSVDFAPVSQEVTTYQIRNQVQDFFFRQGKSAADTLMSSPTADDWYLVEWRDHGAEDEVRLSSVLAAVDSVTWSGIKLLIYPIDASPTRTGAS